MGLFEPSWETIQKIATEAESWFEQDKRNDGTEFWKLKDGRPEWLKDDLVYPAHADMLPDDYKYAFIKDALDLISNHDSEEAAQDGVSNDVDVYTGRLLAWVSSNLTRCGYCDEALEEEGSGGSFFDLMQAGQRREREEVFAAVLQAVKEHAEEEEEEEDEDEDDEDDKPEESKDE